MFRHPGVSVSGLYSFSAVYAGAQYSDTLKVMTYNINAESHGSGSYADIAEVINAINPDINAGFRSSTAATAAIRAMCCNTSADRRG